MSGYFEIFLTEYRENFTAVKYISFEIKNHYNLYTFFKRQNSSTEKHRDLKLFKILIIHVTLPPKMDCDSSVLSIHVIKHHAALSKLILIQQPTSIMFSTVLVGKGLLFFNVLLLDSTCNEIWIVHVMRYVLFAKKSFLFTNQYVINTF